MKRQKKGILRKKEKESIRMGREEKQERDKEMVREFGQLMNASHLSLKEDYEVSCKELDILVEEAWNIDGVLGSRMMGAGFGGCTVSIVEENAVNEFITKVGENYKERTGLTPEFYVVVTGNGASVL